MAGPFSLITGGLLGEPNPADEMGSWSDEQQRRNRAALGLDANGNPLPPSPPGAGAPAGAPAQGGGAGGAAAAAATSTLPPAQEPNATKTPVSLGHTMMNLAQYEQREQGFNQALGTGFAAFAQPRDRAMVSQMFNTTPLDASKLAGQSMSLASQQQGQDRANAVNRMVNDPTMGPNIARSFGMDWGALKAGVLADPGLVARIAETWGNADPKVRAGAQVGQGALPGAGAPGGPGGKGPVSDIGKQIVSEVGGQPDMTAAQTAWDAKHPGQPTPWDRNSPESFKNYAQDQTQKQTNAREFLTKNHGNSIDKVTEFQHQVEDLKNDPGVNKLMESSNAYRSAIDWIRKNPDTSIANVPVAQLATAIPDWAGYPPEIKAALAKIQRLHSIDYSNAMHSIGQRFSTQEVNNVAKGMDNLLNVELSHDDYNKGLDQLIEDTKTIRANSHGAAQEFDTMDPDLRTYVNPTFTKGGRSNVEGSGSEDWADKVKPPQSEIDGAKAALARGVSRTEVNRRVREHGYRPMGF